MLANYPIATTPIAGEQSLSTDIGLILNLDAYDLNSFSQTNTTNLLAFVLANNVYLYATGPVTTNVLDEALNSKNVSRYTITQSVNQSRAYFSVSGLTLNKQYTFSFKWKYNGTNTSTPTIVVSGGKGYPIESSELNNVTLTGSQTDTPLGSGWYSTVYKFSLPSSSYQYGAKITYGILTNTDATYVNNTFDICDEIFEGNSVSPSATDRTVTYNYTNIWSDLSGNNNNFKLLNGYEYKTKSISFDGINDSGILNSTSSINADKFAWTPDGSIGSQYMTISIWVKTTDTIGSLYSKLWNYTLTPSETLYPNIKITPTSISLGNATAVNSNYASLTSAMLSNIADGNWNNFVLWMDNTNFGYYKNGVAGPTAPHNFTTKSLTNIQVNPTLMTAYPILDNWTGNTAHSVSGDISIIKIYNRVLTATEVLSDYNTILPRFLSSSGISKPKDKKNKKNKKQYKILDGIYWLTDKEYEAYLIQKDAFDKRIANKTDDELLELVEENLDTGNKLSDLIQKPVIVVNKIEIPIIKWKTDFQYKLDNIANDKLLEEYLEAEEKKRIRRKKDEKAILKLLLEDFLL